jgi:hypothetical protein
MIALVLFIFAFVFFAVAIFNPAPLARWNLIAAGLAFWIFGAEILPALMGGR